MRSELRQELFTRPKLNTFLNAMKRNSVSTWWAYATSFTHFQRFLDSTEKYRGYNPDSILEKLSYNQIDLYELLDSFVSFFNGGNPRSVRLRVEAVKSFLEYYDIEISPRKFKRRCLVPKLYREDEEALTAAIIRKMLLSCSNRRLKPYLLTLASGGFRAVEALSIRNCDINFDSRPVTVKIRKEYSKTRTARYSFISDEAAEVIKQWLSWKYRPRPNSHRPNRKSEPEDFVFMANRIRQDGKSAPMKLYNKICVEFDKLLDIVGLNEKKDGGFRRKYTLHSFRRFVKTILETNISHSYSEWALGHAKSSYWVKTPEEKAEEYLKVMKYLTFLDYDVIESKGKSIESRLESTEKENEILKAEIAEWRKDREKFQEAKNDMDKFKREITEFLDKLAKDGKIK